MFQLKEHMEFSEACFERDKSPENRDMALCVDFSSLPSPYGKGFVRVVMDGVTNADGAEAVEIAARTLLRDLCGRLTAESRSLALELAERLRNGGADEDIREWLAGIFHRIIQEALVKADEALLGSEYPKPFCTVSVAVVFYRYIFTANLGDSPIYLLDLNAAEKNLTPLFECHNMAGKAMAAGQMTEEEMLVSPKANLLNKFLGNWKDRWGSRASYMVRELPQSCILLLGSDGALGQLLCRDMAGLIDVCREDGLEAVRQELEELVGASGSVDDFTITMDWIESD